MSKGSEQYVVVIDGDASPLLDKGTAYTRAEYHGTVQGKDVQLHLMRGGKSVKIVHAWKNWKQTK